MTFGGFKETSESMENNEAKTENTEKNVIRFWKFQTNIKMILIKK